MSLTLGLKLLDERILPLEPDFGSMLLSKGTECFYSSLHYLVRYSWARQSALRRPIAQGAIQFKTAIAARSTTRISGIAPAATTFDAARRNLLSPAALGHALRASRCATMSAYRGVVDQTTAILALFRAYQCKAHNTSRLRKLTRQSQAAGNQPRVAAGKRMTLGFVVRSAGSGTG
jgi:hypothetical protein